MINPLGLEAGTLVLLKPGIFTGIIKENSMGVVIPPPLYGPTREYWSEYVCLVIMGYNYDPNGSDPSKGLFHYS